MRMLELLPGLAFGALLLWAVWRDIQTRRIPNRLVLAGALLGLALHTLLPHGAGLFQANPGALGPLASLGGAMLGLLLLFPFYALRALGAGDVKLMAMVGAWIGPWPVVGATLLTMIAGGVLALAAALLSGTLSKVLANVRNMMERLFISTMAGQGTVLPPPPEVTGKLAYASAIACGTGAQLVLAGSPAWQLFS
jgi:prepilin peptidase CpaA